MKNILIIILLISPLWTIAQDEAICGDTPWGFSTDPENATNPECSTIVNTFDWRTPRWYTPFYLGKESIDNSVPSPFFNDANLAIPEIYRTDTYAGKDFEVEDGWELIIDGITEQQGGQTESTIVYLALYNKYTGILRIFGAHYNIGNNASDYDYAIIRLKFDQTGNKELTGLLHPTQQIAQPLDQTSIKEIERNSKLTDVSPGQFFYADFPIAYDPCTCFSDQLGTIVVSFEVVDNREVKLYGRAVSISRTLEEIAGSQSQISEDFLTNIHSANGDNPSAGSQVFRTLGDLSGYYYDLKVDYTELKEQYEAVEKLKKSLELAATIAAAAAAIPTGGTSTIVVNGVVQTVNNSDVPKIFKASAKAKTLEKPLMGLAKYVDLFSGSLKSKKDAAQSALTAVGATRIISSEMVFDGNIQNTAYRGGFKFYVPGQPNNSNNNCSSPYYPMYNEVLGRFALLETPKVGFGTTITSNVVTIGSLNKFQFESSSFKYMFNPAAHINEDNTEIFAALVIKSVASPCSSANIILDNLEKVESLSNSAGGVPIHLSTYVTPFVPIECLEQTISQIQTFTPTCTPQVEVYLRLIIIYDYDANGSDGDRVQNFEIITYPVERVPKNLGEMGSVPTNANGSIPFNTTINTTNYNITENIFAWDTIFIDGDLTANAGVNVELSASTIIMTGGSIGQGITLVEKGTPFGSCTPITPFDPVDLAGYCGNEATYKANRDKNARLIEPNSVIDDKPTKPISFQSTPNPFTNTFNLEFELEEGGETSLIVYDALVRVVETVIVNDNLSIGKHQYQIDGTKLGSGVYYVKLNHSNGTQTIKIIKQ